MPAPVLIAVTHLSKRGYGEGSDSEIRALCPTHSARAISRHHGDWIHESSTSDSSCAKMKKSYKENNNTYIKLGGGG